MPELSRQRPIFTSHARRQMRLRRIPRQAVLHVLEHHYIDRPAPVRPGATPTRILIGEFDGRALKVYIEEGSNPPVVKTAVWEGD